MPRTRPLTLALSLVFAALSAASIQAQAQEQEREDDNIVTYYEVRGQSTKEPNQDRVWSESYDARYKAEERLAEIQRDHGPGGLLESSTDKPIGLRVEEVKYRLSRAPASRRQEPPADEGTSRGRVGEPPAQLTNVAGTTWVGTEGWNDTSYVRFEFKADGQVFAHDELGIGVWSGTWRMVGTTTVVFQLTQPGQINYSGQIKGNVLSGTARNVSTGGKAKWSVTLQ